MANLLAKIVFTCFFKSPSIFFAQIISKQIKIPLSEYNFYFFHFVGLRSVD